MIAVKVHEHDIQEEDAGADDPCKSLGCNKYGCSWTTGEVIEKVAARKSCKNSHVL